MVLAFSNVRNNFLNFNIFNQLEYHYPFPRGDVENCKLHFPMRRASKKYKDINFEVASKRITYSFEASWVISWEMISKM